MTGITDLIDQEFRDFKTDGVASSGAYTPKKPEIRKLGPLIEAAIAAAAGSNANFAQVEALVEPLLTAAEIARDNAEEARDYLNTALAAIPASVAEQLDLAVADATTGAELARDLAQAAQAVAELSAAFAEEFSGDVHPDVATGEAATPIGKFFRVPIGTVPETYTRYENRAGGAVEAEPLATTSVIRASFGIIFTGGTADDSAAFQIALDAAEAAGIPLIGKPNTQININGTVYYGNVRLLMRWAKLNFILDGNFTTRGTSDRRVSGAMLSKASENAGYGYATVSLEYDELNVVATRSSTVSTLKTGIILSMMHRFAGGEIWSHSETSVAAGCSGIDFWGGIQNADTGVIHYHRENDFNPEGLWFRNLRADRTCRNWSIAGLVLSGSGADEMFSLFTAPGIVANMEFIDIGFIQFELEAVGGGLGVSVMDNNGHDPERFRNISIGKITGVIKGVNSLKSDTFGIKFTHCAPEVSSIRLRYTGSWGTVPIVHGVRSIVDTNQVLLPHIGKLHISLDYEQENIPTTANAVTGNMTIDRLIIDGSGSGWKNGVSSTKRLRQVDIRDGKDDLTKLFTNNAATGVEEISGEIAGPLQNVNVYKNGRYWLNHAKWGERDWFLHTSTSNPAAIALKGVDVRAQGIAGTLGRVMNIASGGPKDIPVELDYTLDNEVGLAVTKDSMGTYGKLVRALVTYRVGNALTKVKRVNYSTGGTLTIAAGEITPTAEIHRVETEAGAAADDLIKINAGEYEGQTLLLYGATAGHVVTIKHNEPGGNIQTRTGANVDLSTTGYVMLVYSTATNKWHVNA